MNFNVPYNSLHYEMSESEKYKTVAMIFHLEKAKARLKARKRLFSQNRNEEKNGFTYSENLHRALECISPESKHLLRKEFLEEKESYWYEKYYSKTTYYKYRRNAVDEFLAYYISETI
ncbi:MG284/MPN403 family protein [Mycoplasma tauri]|uniref:Uncharacterized protein n=1 Tax=Mycoplasma tauri TaxID=547987 RepID=A0A953T754_9MOLU|nr:hypothetical protein [Mycoplasma tauri]MBZ4195302.1 hypothetical protein [Mycoplasma tauri]MBZ4203834.1 hypothetical protein [Mycoplasma tauri]MBZ4204042.1 hypothetical protein [Mycoplasma tauri]MBZ4212877.1 hypothetical protein [Mycoplasma tauri]MBZ4218309.1 hypothetical protein [Mycoplasma tauri]